MIGVGHAAQQRADVEGLLALGVGRGTEDLAEHGELGGRTRVRRYRDIPVVRVGGRSRPGEALARRNIRVLVVRQQHVDGSG